MNPATREHRQRDEHLGDGADRLSCQAAEQGDQVDP